MHARLLVVTQASLLAQGGLYDSSVSFEVLFSRATCTTSGNALESYTNSSIVNVFADEFANVAKLAYAPDFGNCRNKLIVI
jgi:hypothetical protein